MIIGILLLIYSVFFGLNAINDYRLLSVIKAVPCRYTETVDAVPIFLIIKIIFMIISLVTGVSCMVG